MSQQTSDMLEADAQDFATIASAEHERRRRVRLAPLRAALTRLSDRRLLAHARKTCNANCEGYRRLADESGLSHTTLNEIARGLKTRLRAETRERLIPFLVELDERHSMSEP